jgi:hypothetical protein
MPPGDKPLTADAFLVWFDALPVEVQREVLQCMAARESESYLCVNIVKLFTDAPLHIAPRLYPVLSLN